MKAYGQFCPLAQATQLLCERWTLLIVRELIAGSRHYNEIHKGVPLISPTLLATRLKQLCSAGILEPKQQSGHRFYQLTDAGKELRPIVEIMGAWGHRWARSKLEPEDLDAGLLMWDIRRSINPTAFPQHRIVVEFEFPDAPEGNKHWWLVSEQGEIDLCFNDHGYDVDLLIRCPLETMTRVWICEQPFNDAVKKGDIKLMGCPELSDRAQNWLCSSPLSKLGTSQEMPTLEWKF